MKRIYATVVLFLVSTTSTFGQSSSELLNSGDTAWVLIATALVMLMTPAGLALFYGGLTQNKHVLNTIGMSYMAFCTGTIVWVIIGYSLAFSEGNAFIGGLDNFLKTVGSTNFQKKQRDLRIKLSQKLDSSWSR